MKFSSIKKTANQAKPAKTTRWTPRNLRGLIAWFSFRSQLRGRGDTNPQFLQDLGGRSKANRITLAQPTLGNRPQIKDPDDDVFPRSPHLQFITGLGSKYMIDSTPPTTLDIGTGDFLFCCGVKTSGGRANNTIMSLQREDNSEEIRIYVSGGVFTAKIGDGTVATAANVADNTPHIVSVSRINGKLQAFVDGVGGTERDNTVDIDNDAQIVLGALTTTGNQGFNGSLAEVVIAGTTRSGFYTNRDRILLEGYVAGKLGISKELDSSHKFRKGRPKR